MLALEGVDLPGREAHRPIFSGLSLSLGYRHALIISESEEITAGFVNLVTGLRHPTRGKVKLAGRPSWPIGQSVTMRSALTGRETIQFLADLYDLNARRCFDDAVRWFSLERMAQRLVDWPAPERIRFERLAALWPEFDVMVVYGAGLTGDEAFDAEWVARFQQRVEGRGLIAVAPPLEPLSWMCDITIVVRESEAVCYDNLSDALLAATPVEPAALYEEARDRSEPGQDDFI